VRVVPFPDLPNVEVQSRIALTQEPCGTWRRGIRHEVEEHGLLVTVLFTGSYPAACGERTWSLSVLDAARFTESGFRWLWSEAGGVLRGKVRAGIAPTDARVVATHESPPLADLVRDMNKHSNNVMARHLFLALSAQKDGVGTEARSAVLLREWMAGRHLPAEGFLVENGSGLSREERASAATIAAVLRHAWGSALMPEFISSLPIYGVDGTLKSRKAATAVGEAHLKGGTLNTVQSVAGFVLDRKGRRWIVVMMVNHDKAGAAQPALDALVEWVHARS
jgi:D-alanyl-D-alanine carboxypeptidase/D-alanyl-D-alanine-endopeptidase (penicillin-binding protein 4)